MRAVLALGTCHHMGRAVAQQRPRLRRVGYLIATRSADFPALHGALRAGLRDLGYVDGKNVEILVRSADGSTDRYPALVADLVEQRVEVIVAANTPAALAARAAAPGTPLVFAGVGDPVASGLVASLARPGGNATGVTLLTPELTPKRLELLKEAVPELKLVAVLWNPDIKGHARELGDLEAMSGMLGVRLVPVAVREPQDLDAAFASMSRGGANGLLVLASPLHHRHIRQIADLALNHRLPAICEFSEFAGVGGLMVYGPSWPDLYRHAATYVARILDGARAGELPVEQPVKIELVINANCASALGIAVPQPLLLRADRIIR